MPALQTGKQTAWSTLPTTITRDGVPQDLVPTEFTITNQSELEKLKDGLGDITTHVYHGKETTARLVAYPASTTPGIADLMNEIPDCGEKLNLTFAAANHPGNGLWEITNVEDAVTNTSQSIHTFELVRAL
jgi:hypothetical protein